MKITAALLKECCPNSHLDLNKIAEHINEFFPKFGITSNREVRYYLAQCFQETDGLRTFREYADGSAYEGRRDLGNVNPGDGKLFRGRGMIMTTGRENVTKFYRWLVQNRLWSYAYTLLEKPALLETPYYGVLAACFYYQDHVWSGQHIKAIIAGGDFENLTKAVNGGLNGYKQRLEYLGKLNKVLGDAPLDWAAASPIVVKPLPTVVETAHPAPVGFIPELMALITKYFGAKK